MDRTDDARDRVKRVYSRPLNRNKTRRLAVEMMPDGQLWSRLIIDLGNALDALERWDTREGFYTVARCLDIAIELDHRGEQLVLFEGKSDKWLTNPYRLENAQDYG